jgi:hypothetical protein
VNYRFLHSPSCIDRSTIYGNLEGKLGMVCPNLVSYEYLPFLSLISRDQEEPQGVETEAAAAAAAIPDTLGAVAASDSSSSIIQGFLKQKRKMMKRKVRGGHLTGILSSEEQKILAQPWFQ